MGRGDDSRGSADGDLTGDGTTGLICPQVEDLDGLERRAVARNLARAGIEQMIDKCNLGGMRQ